MLFVSKQPESSTNTFHENGIAERVHLPDGGVFIVAGRVDVLGGGFILSVDSGNSGNNLEAFCAALS